MQRNVSGLLGAVLVVFAATACRTGGAQPQPDQPGPTLAIQRQPRPQDITTIPGDGTTQVGYPNQPIDGTYFTLGASGALDCTWLAYDGSSHVPFDKGSGKGSQEVTLSVGEKLESHGCLVWRWRG